MEIRKECDYGFEELIKALTNVPMSKDTKKISIFSIILLAIGILFIVLSFSNKDLKYFLLICGIIVCICTLFILIVCILDIPVIKSKLFYKKVKEANKQLTDGIKYEFIFNDSNFTVNSISNTINSSVIINYNDVSRFTYNSNNLYIFVNKYNTYMCKKILFTDEEFKEVLLKMPNNVLK